MNELVAFVREALTAGHPRPEIHQALARAGWPEDEIADALSRYSDVEFPIPVPHRRQSGSAREAFLYLVTFVALYISAVSIGALIFGIIDHYVPDPLAYNFGDSESDGLRWNVASIVVAFPLYLILTRMHLTGYARDPERRSSGVGRWLTYLTLFVAACVIISTMIMLIGGVLGGELASRFLFKTIAALILAVGVLVYYLWEMRVLDKPTGGPERPTGVKPMNLGREVRA